MRYPVSESWRASGWVDLSVKRTPAKLGVARATFYRWYDLYQTVGPGVLDDRSRSPWHSTRRHSRLGSLRALHPMLAPAGSPPKTTPSAPQREEILVSKFGWPRTILQGKKVERGSRKTKEEEPLGEVVLAAQDAPTTRRALLTAGVAAAGAVITSASAEEPMQAVTSV